MFCQRQVDRVEAWAHQLDVAQSDRVDAELSEHGGRGLGGAVGGDAQPRAFHGGLTAAHNDVGGGTLERQLDRLLGVPRNELGDRAPRDYLATL